MRPAGKSEQSEAHIRFKVPCDGNIGSLIISVVVAPTSCWGTVRENHIPAAIESAVRKSSQETLGTTEVHV